MLQHFFEDDGCSGEVGAECEPAQGTVFGTSKLFGAFDIEPLERASIAL